MATTLKASEFKARCLQLMDDVAATGESIIITKHNRPVAALVPVLEPAAQSPFGWHRGQVEICGDIITPLGTDDWEVLE